MLIHVETVTGKTYQVEMCGEDYLGDLAQRVSQLSGISDDMLSFIFLGTQLHPDNQLDLNGNGLYDKAKVCGLVLTLILILTITITLRKGACLSNPNPNLT